MTKEIKICLPLYKIGYSVFFIAVLSLIRGVSLTFEIGRALEPPIALLTAVFCGDTYVQEIASRRWEIERLFPLKNRMISVFARIGFQELYLLILAAAGYGMFYIIQKPIPYGGGQSAGGSERDLFLAYLAAIAVTMVFWGILSVTLSCLFRSMWAGIGGCLILWIMTNSTAGDRLLGKWNIFSYSLSAIGDGGNIGDMGWICGKLLCIVFSIGMAAALPEIIKKRG